MGRAGEIFQDYAYYYNVFYKDKDYTAEARQVDVLLKKYGNNIRNIMNFGCGTGKHDIELSKLGYECSGVDMSLMMIKTARENSIKERAEIKFDEGDAVEILPTLNEKYDAVISLFHVMSYQTGNDDILAGFRSAKKLLDKGGLFLFDVWYGPGVLSDRPVVRVKEVQDDRTRLVRIARPVMHDKTNTVDIGYEILSIDKGTNETKVINEVHSMRYFFRPEMEIYLKETGFELIDSVDCTTLGETDYNSWTCYFMARAI